MEADELWTSTELAKVLRVSPATLARWRKRDEGPPFIQMAGGTVRYTRHGVSDWVRTRMVAAGLSSAPAPEQVPSEA